MIGKATFYGAAMLLASDECLVQGQQLGVPTRITSNKRPVFAQCKLQHDSTHNAPDSEGHATEGFLRLRQSYGQPLLITGYSKYLPTSHSQKFAITVNELPHDEFYDCTSTGGFDKVNTAEDLTVIGADEDGFSWYEANSETMTFFGDGSIMGKSLVIHSMPEIEADGLTDNKMTGGRSKLSEGSKPIACCTITRTNFFL